MKKIIILLSIVTVLLASCNFGGDSSTLTITVDSACDAYYCYSTAFPESWTTGTAFDIENGEIAVEYALADTLWNSSTSRYECYINTWDYHYYSSSVMSATDSLAYFLWEEEGVGGKAVYKFTVTISSGLFSGIDYTLNLAWDVSDSTISKGDLILEKTVIEDEGIITFSDGDTVFTIDVEKSRADSTYKEIKTINN